MISPPSEKLTKVPFALPESLYEWVRETAFKRRVSMAEVVREALREYREHVDPQMDLPMVASANDD